MENNEYQSQETARPALIQKNSSKTGLYVVIAVLATLVVGLAVALVIVLVSSNKTDGAEEPGEQKEPAKISAVEQRDSQRRGKLNSYSRAAQDYQTNNTGKTPWASGKTAEKFVQRYIDEYCEMDLGDKYETSLSVEESYKCRAGAEGWLDPDGNAYKTTVVRDIERFLMDNGSNDVSIRSYLGKWPNGYRIIVVPGTSCGKEGGSVTYRSGAMQFSLSMRLEGGDIACVDNY